jgi:asparagine synthetase B (glutamine-hydrolysing)
MCGIFGIIASPDSLLTSKDLRAGVLKAFHESERRGKDSSGAMHISTQKIVVTKSPARGKDLIKTKIFQELLAGALNDYERGETFIFFGHTRMATHGSADVDVNNQPVLSERSVVLHNGIIVNFEEIFEATPELKREHEVDSEIIPLLIDNFRRIGHSEMDSVVKTAKKIVGANTFLYLNSNSNTAYLNSSNGSLYVLENESKGLFAFASEKQTLDKILLEVKYVSVGGDVYQPLRDLPMEVKFGNYTSLRSKSLASNKVGIIDSEREIINVRKLNDPAMLSSESFSRNARREFSPDFHSKIPNFGDLLRCTRCILPRNYPYLSFDENGVCKLCQSYGTFPQYGTEKLKRDLDIQEGKKYLIPISGGRDSCYVLHYAVKELNLETVAFTYDWGFVTDIARRNISRMCGELGVEHILVAADLKMKRSNVQKNVSAWLKKPHLGMIPLFMAGDKDFFRFASEVKNELNLSNSLFGMTRFEPAGFKTGFAGIKETNQYEKTFDLGVLNKVKLTAFYAKQSLLNPRYLNSSLIDSLSGYYSYYMRKIDYLQLYDYINWNEQETLSKIKSEYGWESSAHTKNSWRIGDASAPFYNYLYSYFAGFTENDVYLSNLIREKQITREHAMELILDYNFPDEHGFLTYCELIGLDPYLVLSQIHKSRGFTEGENF